jgi:hypothetical protein
VSLFRPRHVDAQRRQLYLRRLSKLEYHPPTFRFWAGEVKRYRTDIADHWFQVYRPRQPGRARYRCRSGRGEDAALFSVVVGPAGTVLAIEAHPVTLG